MSMFNLLAQDVLDHFVSNATWTAPTNVFVGLSTTTPAEDGTNITEPSGNGYARVSTSNSDWNSATLADPSILDNANAITFPTASGGNWGTVTHFVLFSLVTGGDALWFGALDTSKAVNDGDTAEFAAGELNLSLD